MIMAHEVAVAHAFVTFKGLSAEGKELRTMHNRLTWALKQTGEVWKIVHEHTSAPVNYETSKVAMRLGSRAADVGVWPP
jgi:ketosteroid isomerase-like protein